MRRYRPTRTHLYNVYRPGNGLRLWLGRVEASTPRKALAKAERQYGDDVLCANVQSERVSAALRGVMAALGM